ncbi:hypothetical protein ARMSODRAFT_169215 [Armillaria solidipes]|uniref:Uncharacterized protein n=1 Tax=Armillaria solidipes TaxID=1076256 RepID=A0A2H3AH78_9AGAR|nr:hypothetical protein ARMSODRAFT_169215 [Armillaria solidipes]
MSLQWPDFNASSHRELPPSISHCLSYRLLLPPPSRPSSPGRGSPCTTLTSILPGHNAQSRTRTRRKHPSPRAFSSTALAPNQTPGLYNEMPYRTWVSIYLSSRKHDPQKRKNGLNRGTRPLAHGRRGCAISTSSAQSRRRICSFSSVSSRTVLHTIPNRVRVPSMRPRRHTSTEIWLTDSRASPFHQPTNAPQAQVVPFLCPSFSLGCDPTMEA